MDLSFELSTILLGIVAGLLIGSAGIGGVIVVPALIFLYGIPATTALAATMLAFLMSGIVGATAYSSRRSLNWNAAAWLWLGAAPGALVAGFLTHRIADWLIETAIGLLALAAGIYSVRKTPRVETEPTKPMAPRAALIGPGLTTGILSALTGTGGPLVLLPILLRLELPVLTALGLAQAIQLPIALMATTGHWIAGTAEPRLGITLGIGIGIGTWGGTRLAHRLASHVLRRIVSMLLIVVGLAMLLKLGLVRSSA